MFSSADNEQIQLNDKRANLKLKIKSMKLKMKKRSLMMSTPCSNDKQQSFIDLFYSKAKDIENSDSGVSRSQSISITKLNRKSLSKPKEMRIKLRNIPHVVIEEASNAAKIGFGSLSSKEMYKIAAKSRSTSNKKVRNILSSTSENVFLQEDTGINFGSFDERKRRKISHSKFICSTSKNLLNTMSTSASQSLSIHENRFFAKPLKNDNTKCTENFVEKSSARINTFDLNLNNFYNYSTNLKCVSQNFNDMMFEPVLIDQFQEFGEFKVWYV